MAGEGESTKSTLPCAVDEMMPIAFSRSERSTTRSPLDFFMTNRRLRYVIRYWWKQNEMKRNKIGWNVNRKSYKKFRFPIMRRYFAIVHFRENLLFHQRVRFVYILRQFPVRKHIKSEIFEVFPGVSFVCLSAARKRILDQIFRAMLYTIWMMHTHVNQCYSISISMCQLEMCRIFLFLNSQTHKLIRVFVLQWKYKCSYYCFELTT